MSATVLSYYQDKLTHYQGLAQQKKKAIRQVAILRFVWFVVSIVALGMATQSHYGVLILTALIGISVFVALLIKHQRMSTTRQGYLAFAEVYRHECDILQHNYQDYDGGQVFVKEDHPYAKDLDLFGRHSLFQYLNRSFTALGAATLAKRLLQPLPNKSSIETHQANILELSQQHAWVEHFLAQGILCQQASHTGQQSLAQWIQQDDKPIAPHWRYSSFLLIACNISMLVISILGMIPANIFLIYILIALGIVGSQSKHINAQHNGLNKHLQALQSWRHLFVMAEAQSWKAAGLQHLQQALKQGAGASLSISQLTRIAQAFDTRLNILAWPLLNFFMAWDIRQSLRLSQWQHKHAHELPQWFQNIAELETEASFALFYRSQAAAHMPHIQSGPFSYQAQEAFHPLMAKAVANDIAIDEAPFFRILTGANMAGKSTYLRTIGSNMILALAGSAVCAKRMHISPIQLFTSIKTTDSLAKSESYFYAELHRLQNIIQQLEQGTSLFIILDEILKGTNSHDKAQGSTMLIEKLVRLKASGIIATHDLSLGSLAQSFPTYIYNSCFEVDIAEDELHFDYKLRQGISQNLNATFLMKKMGIVDTKL